MSYKYNGFDLLYGPLNAVPETEPPLLLRPAPVPVGQRGVDRAAGKLATNADMACQRWLWDGGLHGLVDELQFVAVAGKDALQFLLSLFVIDMRIIIDNHRIANVAGAEWTQ
jgi:hypothetical protein